MIRCKDQLGRTHQFKKRPERIVSLVPSITELLCDLGLEDLIKGCTRYCIHPGNLQERVTNVGGTKKLNLEAICALQPDIIIANKEENNRQAVLSLARQFNVWVSDVGDLETAKDLIHRLGILFDRETYSETIISANVSALDKCKFKESIEALYLIWRKPFMSVGHDTYIHSVMQYCNIQNPCATYPRYPTLTNKDMQAMQPSHIFLSSEPFPFRDRHIREIEALYPVASVRLVDGEFFSWYGSRLSHKSSLFAQQK